MIEYIQILNTIKYLKIMNISSVILLDSIFVNSNKEYCTQILLEECKYAIKDILNKINEKLESSKSDDESDE